MALFKRKAPMKNLHKQLAELRSRAASLSEKLKATDAALAAAVAARQKHLLSGDLADEHTAEKLQADVDSCNSRLSALTAGIDEQNAQIDDVERKVKAEEQAIERANAADKLGAQVSTMEAILPTWLEQSRALAAALSAVGGWHFESGQMARFVQNTMSEIELAANFTLAELKAMPDAIRGGRQPIPREYADAHAVNATEPAPKAQRRPNTVPDLASDPVLAAANFQPLDRGPDRILKITP
jgi:chromosome segregation ATPase